MTAITQHVADVILALKSKSGKYEEKWTEYETVCVTKPQQLLFDASDVIVELLGSNSLNDLLRHDNELVIRRIQHIIYSWLQDDDRDPNEYLVEISSALRNRELYG